MINKTKITEFFNGLADDWDKNLIINEDCIKHIFEISNLTYNLSILDVACGTGIMIPYYWEYKPEYLLGIDISSGMIDIAKEKYPDTDFICGDVMEYSNRKFDRIYIYNAFPHFNQDIDTILHLADILNDEGYLTICHNMTREKINSHHSNLTSSLSNDLINSEDLMKIMKEAGLEKVYVSKDKENYLVCAKK